MNPESPAPEPALRKRRPRYPGKNPRRFEQKYKERNATDHPETLAKVLASGKTPAGSHRPIMVAEILEALRPAPGEVAVDCTLGFGGHAAEILQRIAPSGMLLGIDADPVEIVRTEARMRALGFNEQVFRARRSNFGGLPKLLAAEGRLCADVILADLGVSSMQIDDPARGFSFKENGPLDMRMNPNAAVTARALVNTASVEQLERIFREFGEEPQARRIASRLVRDRAVHSIDTTLDLARSVESVVARRGKAHPATRVFQALRIAVNRELEVLSRGLEVLSQRLSPGGRLAVITFHSLEDRIVKHFFQHRSTPTLDRPDWSAPRPNPEWIFCKVTGKPLTASDDEIRANPRARSAKLRVVERIPEPSSRGRSPLGSPP